MIEPERVEHGRGDVHDLPLLQAAVGDRQACTFTRRIVASDDVIAGFSDAPPSVEVVLAQREAISHFAPPPRTGGGHRRERQHVVRHRGPPFGDVELHGELAVDDGENEAAVVEAQLAQGERGTTADLGIRARSNAEGVDGNAERLAALAREASGDRIGEDVPHPHCAARPEVEHTATGGMPRLASGHGHVDVVFIGEVGTVQPYDLELGGRLRLGVLGALFVGLQGTRRGMRSRVLPRDAGDDGVLEDEAGVAVHQVTAIDPLANEQRLVEGAVVVGKKDLVEPSAKSGDRERRTAEADTGGSASDPERRVQRSDEELRRRGWRRHYCRTLRCAASDEQEQSAAGGGTNHRGKYNCDC